MRASGSSMPSKREIGMPNCSRTSAYAEIARVAVLPVPGVDLQHHRRHGADQLGIEPAGVPGRGGALVAAEEGKIVPYARRAFGELWRGAVITSINRTPIRNMEDYREAVESLSLARCPAR